MSQSSSGQQHPRPLAELRVLDLTRVLAGPYCTMILADLGAEVVKIEHPDGGDDARGFGPFLSSGLSAYFASVNRGKKSVALDLKQPGDRDTFLKLAGRADVLVENFRPGAMARLGLGSQYLRELNPRLVYASLSGFGQSGPNRDRPAYDVVVQALSGLMSITGEEPGQFVRVGTSISDILTGLFGAVAIVSALRHRDRTGRGCTADLAMLDCTVAALENAISRFAVTGDEPAPIGTRHPSITPFQAFDTRDRAIVVAAGNDGLWRRLCEVLGLPQHADESRLATNAARTENHAYLEDCLAPVFSERTQRELLEALSEVGVPCASIRTIAEVAADPQLQSREMLHEMSDGDEARFLTAGSPLRMEGQAPQLSRHAPQLGEHSDSVLEEWLNET